MARLAQVSTAIPGGGVLSSDQVLCPLRSVCARIAASRQSAALCQTRTLSGRSFDHLIGAGEKGGWDREAERVGGLEVDDQLELSRPLNGQLGRLRTVQ